MIQQPEIVRYQPVAISSLVHRITAGNAGIMTGPGTNSYIVGREQLALIDPGPIDEKHIDAILQFCGDRLRWIFVTHTHPDHSPAAKIIAGATGADVFGNLIDDDGRQDTTFDPLCGFEHNDLFEADEFSLRVLATPGHVGNHLCYLLTGQTPENEKICFTGDHIMQGSTVVITPPNGSMKAYIESLQLLLNYPIDALAPAHGQIILEPDVEIKKLIKHRLQRESKVASALRDLQRGSLDALTPIVYNDVHVLLHPIARHSLLAHLLKLQQEVKAIERNDEWHWLA